MHADSPHSSSTTTIEPDSFWDNFYLFETHKVWTTSCMLKTPSPWFCCLSETRCLQTSGKGAGLLWNKDSEEWLFRSSKGMQRPQQMTNPEQKHTEAIGEVEGCVRRQFWLSFRLHKRSALEWQQCVQHIYKSGTSFLEGVNLDNYCLNKNLTPSQHLKGPHDVRSTAPPWLSQNPYYYSNILLLHNF